MVHVSKWIGMDNGAASDAMHLDFFCRGLESARAVQQPADSQPLEVSCVSHILVAKCCQYLRFLFNLRSKNIILSYFVVSVIFCRIWYLIALGDTRQKQIGRTCQIREFGCSGTTSLSPDFRTCALRNVTLGTCPARLCCRKVLLSKVCWHLSFSSHATPLLWALQNKSM